MKDDIDRLEKKKKNNGPSKEFEKAQHSLRQMKNRPTKGASPGKSSMLAGAISRQYLWR
jgi:hypothetical protein